MSASPAPIVRLSGFHHPLPLLQPCDNCGSHCLTHVAFLKQTFGDDWELLLKAEKGSVH